MKSETEWRNRPETRRVGEALILLLLLIFSFSDDEEEETKTGGGIISAAASNRTKINLSFRDE